jgi:putative addiction module component (TIGR02574 family)
MKIEGLRKLPLDEKLRIVEELWDDIGSSHAAIPVPDWAKAEARRRAEELDNDPESALTRAEVWHNASC